jgi:hypothetical protein
MLAICPIVEALVSRVKRVAANRPDPLDILAQTVGTTGTIGTDPYAVMGMLVEGAIQTLMQAQSGGSGRRKRPRRWLND